MRNKVKETILFNPYDRKWIENILKCDDGNIVALFFRFLNEKNAVKDFVSSFYAYNEDIDNGMLPLVRKSKTLKEYFDWLISKKRPNHFIFQAFTWKDSKYRSNWSDLHMIWEAIAKQKTSHD